MNRGYSGGLAAGAPAGGGFRSSFQSSFSAPAPSAKQMQPAAPMPGTTQPPMATPAPMDFSLPEPPPVDFSNMFPPEPLPQLGQQSFSQPPPSPFGPQPLPPPLPHFGGFRAEGGPVMPGQAYMVGERGPEMIVPQQPGMVVPNRALTGRASASDGAVRGVDDATMQAIKKRGAPAGNRMPAPVPGVPAVGPALGAPGVPVAARGAVQSFDLTRDLTGWGNSQMTPHGGGPLSARGTRQVGRGMTPQRRLEIAARRGNVRAAETLFNAEQWGRAQPGAPPPMQASPYASGPPPMPASPQAPAPAQPVPSPAPPPLPPAPAAGPAGAAQPPFDMSHMLPPLPMTPGGPLPPSTLMGGSGVPPPPAFQSQTVGGFEVLVQNTPEGPKYYSSRTAPPAPGSQPPPTFEMRRDATGAFRQFYDGQPIAGEPTYSGQVVPGSYVRRQTQGQPAPMQYMPNLPQPTERVTERNADGTTRTYTQPRGAAAPAPAPPPAASTGPVNGMQPYTTPSGVQVELVPDQASVGTQMAQMPNEAYANPLTPEQSLEAARADYLAGDKGAALQKHFQQFPSASTRLANQEAEIWQQVAGQVDAFGRATADRGTARDRRDRWIERDTAGNAIIQGASADRYARAFPQSMKSIDQQLPPLDPSLIEHANNLNKIAQTRRAMNLP